MRPFSKITYCFLVTFIILSSSYGQEKSNFIKLNKLFNGRISSSEDNYGYMWISSIEGLSKYDGYDFSLLSYQTIFGKDFTNDKEYILAKDTQGNLWFSTFKGELTKMGIDGSFISYKEQLTPTKKPLQITAINSKDNNVYFGAVNGVLLKYDLKTSKIDSITTVPPYGKLPQKITDIAFSNSNDIWVQTQNYTIYKYSLTTHNLIQLKNSLIKINQELKIINDKKGDLWIATEFEGLIRYSIKENTSKQYSKLKSNNTNSKQPMFISLFCDSSGIIWAGTDGDGLYRINTENENITIFKHDYQNKFSISDNTITSINEDAHQNIWIYTKSGEINILPNTNNDINYYNGLENNMPTSILSILKSTIEGSIWLGTDGKGLNRIFPDHSKIQYDNTKKGNTFFEGKFIQSLLEDDKGNIWIATYQNGLWVYNISLNTFSKIETSDSSERKSSDIRYLYKDTKNRIWCASNLAILVFLSNYEILATFDYNANGLFGKIARSICEDDNGTIWLGIKDGGLFNFHENVNDLSKSYFTNKNYFTKIKDDITNYDIESITLDHNNHLWILCTSGKLIKYNFTNDSYESHVFNNFLENTFITNLLFENPHSLWVSTNSNGIHNYDINENKLKSYFISDGLHSNSYIKRSSFKEKNGTLYFGGKDGVNSFVPQQMNTKNNLAKLYINAIEILNKPGKLIIGDQLKGSIENVKSIKLDNDQSSFSFQFSAIDNLLNSNYIYTYRLKGFDKDWITSKQERIASYTNIPSGSYTFEVKASSQNGEWNIEPKTIDIIIKAPWWLSPIAFFVYFLIGVILAYSIFKWLRLKNKLAKEEWQNTQEKELYALKMNFFVKMSHEIQTPLTLILGPIEDMLLRAGIKGNELLRQRLLIINNNAKRLSRIATELTTVRNKELGRLRLFSSKKNLIDHIKNIVLSFSEQARFKNIDFIQKYSDEEIIIWYDTDKIEHVIYNLLSNAFKFTPREGSITLKVTKPTHEDFIEISVIDSGPGIPKDELENIFELFYQSDIGKQSIGFGIGLALTKELISLHKGTIHVASSPESGTTFTVRLSTSDTIFSEDEKISVESTNSSKQILDEKDVVSTKEFNRETKFQPKKTHTILIVEDNVEMQQFLSDILSKPYTILIAENGKEGIAMAEKNIPDLILSDIMMPLMDGIEMCTILQKNRKTSHIPIILLTAKNTTKTKLKGLKSGAVEFLHKPFNFQELLLKINNIIDSKEKILQKYKIEVASTPKESVEKSKDDIFLEDLIYELNILLDNPDYKLDELSKTLNMSYSVIYKKCQEITGMNLVEFVRSIKLKKAALLIVKQGCNISEAAFKVGYKDPKYFTKCFKEEFGSTPNDMKKEVKKIGINELLKKYNLQTE